MAYIALYRRFRPNNFDDVVGQDPLIETLRGQVMNKRINHAYLLCGPRGIGKTSVARILAKAINCENPQNGNFCGKCPACMALNNTSNFDIIEIDAASNNGVDNIRDLRENIKFMPAAGRYRVYIIDEVHMLSISAFNALLKTLEEPPEHIVFIMATTEPSKLPVTVLSRCQRFDFNRVSFSDIVVLLKKIAKAASIKIQDDAIVTIARASEGGARDALSLLDQCNAFADGEITQEQVSTILGAANRLMYFALVDCIITEDISRALNGFNKMLNDGCNALTVARDLMTHFRDLFIAKHVKDVAGALSVDDVSANRFIAQAKKAADGGLIRCIELFATLESDLRYASHPRFLIELAIAKACRSESEASYDNLLERVEKIENAISTGAISKSETKAKPKANSKKASKPEVDAPSYDEPNFGKQDEYFPYEDTKETIKSQEKVETKTEVVKKEKDKELKSKPVNKATGKTAKEIWNATIDEMKRNKKMSIVTAMKKGIPEKIEGNVLHILYDPNLAGLDRIEKHENKKLINLAIAKVSESDMQIKISHRKLNEEDKEFMEQVNKFPKDLISTKYDS